MPLAEGLASSSLSLLQSWKGFQTAKHTDLSFLICFLLQDSLPCYTKKATAVIIQVGLYQMNPCLLR